jgi:hypothetical protein
MPTLGLFAMLLPLNCGSRHAYETKGIRSFLSRVKLLGFLSLVMLWLGLLRILPHDFPKDFP